MQGAKAMKDIFLWLTGLYKGSNDPASIIEAVRIIDRHNTRLLVHNDSDLRDIARAVKVSGEPDLLARIKTAYLERFQELRQVLYNRVLPSNFFSRPGTAVERIGGPLENINAIVQEMHELGLDTADIGRLFDKAIEQAAYKGVAVENGKAVLVKEVAPFHRSYAGRDLRCLKDVLDYVARRHRYGTLPLEEMTEELTQALPEEEPPDFYNIYTGAETLLASKYISRFRSGEPIDRIDPPTAKWGIERNDHTYWTFYYTRGFYTPHVEGRFYITIEPSLYKALINDIAGELQTRMKKGEAAGKFYFKLTNEVQKNGNAVRRDHLVVYFNGASGPAVRAAVEDVMQKIESGRPDAFSEKGPYFTMNVRRGLFFGEQPGAANESFGGRRSRVIRDAMAELQRMLNEGIAITPEERAYIVAAVFEANGIDPEFPAFNIDGRKKFAYLFGPADAADVRQMPPADEPPATSGFIPSGREHVITFDMANNWPAGAQEITIGREPSANIRVTQKYISRTHAKIVRNADGTHTLIDTCQKQLISIQTLDDAGVDFVELDFIGPGSEGLGRPRDRKVLKPGKRYRVIIGEVVIEL